MKNILIRPLSVSQFWILNVIAVIVFLLVLVNISMFNTNRSKQAENNARQQYINESIKLNRLSNQLIQSLANLSAQTNDEQIRQLLAEHGIQFTINPTASSKSSSENTKASKDTK